MLIFMALECVFLVVVVVVVVVICLVFFQLIICVSSFMLQTWINSVR